MNKNEMVAEYKKIGEQIHALREEHLNEIEACITKYKTAKTELQAKRAALYAEIRKPTPKAETITVEAAETVAPTADAEAVETGVVDTETAAA